MPAYVIYDPASGAIRGSISGDASALDIEVNTPAGMSSLAVDAAHASVHDFSAWEVKDGALAQIVPTVAELLAAAQSKQSAAMDIAYAQWINNGFTSSALGASYLYPGTDADQANLNAVITASMIPEKAAGWTVLFWCAPSATPAAWNYLPHTSAQIQQVGLDALAYIMAAKMRRAQRNAQIAAATAVDAVEAIVW